MIIEEYLNEGTLIKHYSDAGVLMQQVETGFLYGEAIDIVPCRYTYVETDIVDKLVHEDVETDEEQNDIVE